MNGKGYTIKHEIYNLIIGILREAKSPMSTSGLFREAGLNCPKSPVPEYNQVSWMQGIFYIADKTIAVNTLNGYLWMAVCGIGWAAPGGILLGWALNKNISSRQWIMRFFMLMLLLMVSAGLI